LNAAFLRGKESGLFRSSYLLALINGILDPALSRGETAPAWADAIGRYFASTPRSAPKMAGA